jgi:hypothetical protein
MATMDNKKALFVTLMDRIPLDLKHNEASFSPNSIDSLFLRVAQVPRSGDMAIFVSADRQTNRLLYPLLRMRARGVIIICSPMLNVHCQQ